MIQWLEFIHSSELPQSFGTTTEKTASVNGWGSVVYHSVIYHQVLKGGHNALFQRLILWASQYDYISYSKTYLVLALFLGSTQP